MRYDCFTLPVEPTDQLPVVHRWRGERSPSAILVVAHGMGEHALRYASLAQAMTQEDFVVYSNDQRGHGVTVRSRSQLGDFGEAGWSGLVVDLLAVVERARAEHPGRPILLLGHSMGSMVVQHLLTEASGQIDAAALSGTTAVDVMAGAVTPPGLDVFEAMNAAFAPTRTGFDWLSRDEAEVDRYIADPLCGFTVSESSNADLARAGVAFSTPEAVDRVRKDLPLYLFAGQADPVGGKGKLVSLVAQRYRDAGIEDVSLRLYAGARHEVLREINREEVIADFIEWARRFRVAAGA